MKVKITKDDLSVLTQTAKSVVPNQSPLPILTTILLETAGDKLVATATDLEIGMQLSVPCQVEEEGAVAIPAKEIASIVSKLPDKEITIESSAESGMFTLNYNGSELTLMSYQAENFPQFPDIPDQKSIVFKQECLRKMLRHVLFAVSKDESRPIFKGVNFNFGDSMLTLAATDGCKLAVSKTKLEELPKEVDGMEVIIPSSCLNRLLKILGDNENEVNVFLDENKSQLFFKFNNIVMMSRIIAGKFPNYDVVIPKNFGTEVKVELSSLIDAVDRASLLVDGQHKTLVINVQGMNLSIVFKGSTGTIREEILTELSGDPITLGFNVEYLKETLKTFTGEDIIIKLSGQHTPTMIKPSSGDEHFSILVPVRLLAS